MTKDIPNKKTMKSVEGAIRDLKDPKLKQTSTLDELKKILNN